MSSFRPAVNRHDVIYSLKPKIPFINEYPTIEATSLLTIHFKLLDLRTCRLLVHLINRPKDHSLFPPLSPSLLLPPCDTSATERRRCRRTSPPPLRWPLHQPGCTRDPRCTSAASTIVVSPFLSSFVDLPRVSLFIEVHRGSGTILPCFSLVYG